MLWQRTRRRDLTQVDVTRNNGRDRPKPYRRCRPTWSVFYFPYFVRILNVRMLVRVCESVTNSLLHRLCPVYFRFFSLSLKSRPILSWKDAPLMQKKRCELGSGLRRWRRPWPLSFASVGPWHQILILTLILTLTVTLTLTSDLTLPLPDLTPVSLSWNYAAMCLYVCLCGTLYSINIDYWADDDHICTSCVRLERHNRTWYIWWRQSSHNKAKHLSI